MRFLYWIPAAALAAPLFAQFQNNTQPQLTCEQSNQRSNNQARACALREVMVPATGSLTVDARPNGGITVRGWNRNEVWVRSRVEASTRDGRDPRLLLGQLNVIVQASLVRATGPESRQRENEWWSVSYEIFVPHKTSLRLESVNGGVSLSDVEGRLEAETLNGGINLKRVAGDARVRAVNGGIDIDVEGGRWNGAGLDAQTTNGGVRITLPADYSAEVSARTTNGGLKTDVPVQLRGEIGRGKSVDFTLGGGGAPVKVVTTNGGIVLKRRGGA